MKITNVSADINSQKKISQQGLLQVENKVRVEVYGASQVEAKEEKAAQETQKKGRKTKGVSPEEV